jgi:hypothetical protein
VDRLSWDNYNEAVDLRQQIERYRARHGYYPASLHADRVYRNRENRMYCKDRGIRLSGPALGRPTKDRARSRCLQQRQQRLDERVRVEIEGKFGVSKRKYSLGCVMAKLARTSETAIGVVFLVMGLEKALSILFSRLTEWLLELVQASDSVEFAAV